jgi:hypothetical protein
MYCYLQFMSCTEQAELQINIFFLPERSYLLALLLSLTETVKCQARKGLKL